MSEKGWPPRPIMVDKDAIIARLEAERDNLQDVAEAHLNTLKEIESERDRLRCDTMRASEQIAEMASEMLDLQNERDRLREAATIVLLDLDGAALPVPVSHVERLRESLAEGGDDAT